MPERLRTDIMPIAEKIKEVATTFPCIAIPAGAARPFWLIDSERGVTILAIGVVLSKGTTPQPTPIKGDIATNHLKWTL